MTAPQDATPRQPRVGSLIRAGEWWNYKGPVVAAFCYLTILWDGTDAPVRRTVMAVVLFLVALLGVGGLGHVVNDLADQEQDRRVGVRRSATALSSRRRSALLVGLSILAGVPWLVLDVDGIAIALLVLELALLLAYSLPPVRAKERGAQALWVDAAYAYVVPIALAFATFGSVLDTELETGPVVAALVWATVAGLAAIAQHQASHIDADRVARTGTWAIDVGREAATRWVSRLVVAAAVAFIALLAALVDSVPTVFVWSSLAVLWQAGQLTAVRLQQLPDERPPITFGVRDHVLGPLESRWLSLIVLLTLVVRSTDFWPLLLLHVVLFGAPLFAVVSVELHRVRVLVTFLAHRSRGDDAHAVARRVGSGPTHIDVVRRGWRSVRRRLS